MNNKMIGRLLLLAGLFSSATSMAISSPNDNVATLIEQRLSYMKDVAGYKASHHLAIEDLSQEKKVISDSLALAENLGLNGPSVKPFIQAQMDAAKAIQYRYRADWLSEPEKAWQPQPLEQARTKISALNTDILTRIQSKLAEGSLLTSKEAFMAALNHKNLRDSDRENLWQSLKKITLKKQ